MNSTLLKLVVISCFLALTACQTALVNEQSNTSCIQVDGLWESYWYSDNSACGGTGEFGKSSSLVTQHECRVEDNWTTGQIVGNRVTWNSKPFNVHGGTVTHPNPLISVISNKKISGIHDWSWSDGVIDCDGTTKFYGFIFPVDATDEVKALYGPWQGATSNGSNLNLAVNEVRDKEVLLTIRESDVEKENVARITSDNPLIFTGKLDNLPYEFSLAPDLASLSGTLNGVQISLTPVDKEHKAWERNPYLFHKEGRVQHTFSVEAPGATDVFLAGEMSDWRPDVFRMIKDGNDRWKLTLYLPQGAWQYKFVIDGNWTQDSKNPEKNYDGFGGYNSVLTLGQEDKAQRFNPNIPHGTVQTVNIESQSLETDVPFAIYLPPGYDAKKEDTYPMMLLLHGWGENEQQWISDGKIENFMNNAIDEGVINPFIIVIPNGDKSYYTGDWEQHIMDEVLPYVRSKYRVGSGSKTTAIAGVSMGGFGAFYLTHKYPESFGMSIPISGYFNLNKYYPDVKFDVPMQAQLHLYCGTDDHISFHSNEKFAELLENNGIEFSYTRSEGGHTWRYWNEITPDILKLVSDYFSHQDGG